MSAQYRVTALVFETAYAHQVLRVYIGSFWDQPLNPKGELNRQLFEEEKKDLLDV